jgi:hypothetical protein
MGKKREILAIPADPEKPFSSVVGFDALVEIEMIAHRPYA